MQDPSPGAASVLQLRARVEPAVHSPRGAGAACAWTEAENQSTCVPLPCPQEPGQKAGPWGVGSAGAGDGVPGRGKDSALPQPGADPTKAAPAPLLTSPRNERQ